jgi:hypothetical protein
MTAEVAVDLLGDESRKRLLKKIVILSKPNLFRRSRRTSNYLLRGLC